ncbi:hypothetical protein [Limnovirga soli]|uniref:YD repeat-containing protein n=1 Tax=Limnovirga soli TaxID=2656915 RepID=A0A8J8FAA0_9BACT|nr:hypothetical protein [Limnovirga soli]NNV53862.1 hypothetical protein [Limnovirga soli]
MGLMNLNLEKFKIEKMLTRSRGFCKLFFLKSSMNRIFMSLFFFLGHTFFYINNTFAQTDLPRIIKPAPEASSLFRFQDYPMDYSTGLPQISIPIYEIQSGSLSLPISISYHASGRKVYDQDGPIGLGWSLNAGGMITRTIYGSPDFGTFTIGTYKFPYPFKNQSDLSTNNLDNLQYLEKIMHYANSEGDISVGEWSDSEYDIFSYSCNGLNGKFIFKDVNNIKTPILLPFKPYQITPNFNDNGINSIEITDEKGVSYKFIPGDTYGSGSNSATSSWVISKIIAANNIDSISFKYIALSQERRTISQQGILIDSWDMKDEEFPVNYLEYPEPTTTENYSSSRLVEIDFNQGKIVFNIENNSINDKPINNIQIVNNENEVQKTIQFSRSICYSQSELGLAKNKLDAILFKDKSNATVETYNFEYYPFINPDNNNQLNVRYCDWWGYYNASGQHDFVPRYNNVPFKGSGGATSNITVGNPAANREPNLEALKSCVLKKITFPTGGAAEFVYENNKATLYGANGTPVDGPGLRLYQLKTSDNNGHVFYKTYKYGIGENGYGSIDLLPEMNTMAKEDIYTFLGAYPFGPGPYDPNRGGTYHQRTFYSGFIPELSEIAERPVIYTQVTEYLGTEMSNSGKSIFKYDNSGWAASQMQMFKTLRIPRMHIYNQNYWDNPVLISKEDYKMFNNAGVISYQKVKESQNVYSSTINGYINGLHVQVVSVYPQKGRDMNTHYYAEKFGEEIIVFPNSVTDRIHTFNDYQIPTGFKNLSSSTDITYTDNDPISSTTNYTYNPLYQLPSGKSTINSKGETISSEIFYPFQNSDAVSQQMTALNMLNYPIEQKEYINSIFTKGVKTTYKDWGNKILAPEKIYTSQRGLAYELRLTNFAYDHKGNLLSVGKENDLRKSYMYGYDRQLPIAEVTNAKNDQITSFPSTESVNEIFFDPNHTIPYNITITFTTQAIGPITLKIPNGAWLGSNQQAGASCSIGYTLTNTNGTQSQVGNLCMASNYTVCSPTSNTITFNNMSAGDYTLTISVTNNTSSAQVPFDYSYQVTPMVITGLKEFYYENFEESSGANIATSSPFLGKKYYAGDYTVPYQIPNNRQYKIDYHYLSTGNTWVSISKSFQNNMVLSEGSAIDEVRVYPSDAFMTTYNYELLTGVKGICDINNKVTYYNYDNYSRLRSILDNEKNIIKLIDYSYYNNQSSPPAACNTANCIGPSKKCINGFCIAGKRVNTSTVKKPNGTWKCTYYYVWGGTVPNEGPFTEVNSVPCDIDPY